MAKKIIIVIITTYFLALPKIAYATDNIENGDTKLSDNSENDYQMENYLKEAEDTYNVGDFINESKKYTNDIDIGDIYKSSLTGKVDNNKIIKVVLRICSRTMKKTLENFSSIVLIILIGAILKAISENLGNESVSKIAYFVQFILIVTILLKNFSDIIIEIKSSMSDLLAFSNTLIPLLSTLLIASGHISTSSMLEPLLMLAVTFSCNFIQKVVIPIVLISTAINIVSNLSDQIQLKKFSCFLKKGSIWILTCTLSLIISMASLESNLTCNVDGVTKKASKTIISSAVPVVGNILSNAIETITGYGNIIKNATGICGIVVILAICLKPILKLATYTIFYAMAEAFVEPIADKSIVKVFEIMKDSFKILLGVMFATSMMSIIGLAIVIKISN